MVVADSLLSRVVASIATSGDATPSGRHQKSILSQAAASFARRPTGAESTIPTGFDPQAATLFEAVVEAAFLVANADGDFDEAERNAFEKVVHEACHHSVPRGEVHALVSDLLDQLSEDGIEQRLRMLSFMINVHEHKLEVLRIAALMAHVSGGVAETERAVMTALAGNFGLPADAVEYALGQAAAALGGST
jgi:tellurite resistance protein